MILFSQVIVVLLFGLMVVSCNSAGTVSNSEGITSTPAPTNPPGRCGDGLCDRPENPKNCPEDCS
jgi:hypothetical protein